MKPKEIIKKGIKEKNISQEELAKRCGYKYQSGVTNALNGSTSMRVDGFVRFCEAMGYEVVVRDKETMKVLGRVTKDPEAISKMRGRRPPVTEEKLNPQEAKVDIPVYEYKKR